ncbi:MAG: bifunctional UDP-sugar hydrolase/5'-nucleotidase [Oscillospiraceae bacterium]
MRKLLAVLLALAMCVSLFGCGAAKPAETTAPATEAPVAETSAPAEDVVILYTNDVHTYIDGPMSYDVIAGLKASLKETYGNVLLVDAGDAVQGTAFGSMDKGETIVKLMNAAGYDLATLGNHEFDYGMEGAMNVIDWADYPYVSCNFYHEENGVKGESVLDAYKIFEIGGRKIAFVGITTPETFTKSTPAYFQDDNGNYIYGISGGEDGAELYAEVQAAIDAAKAEGANLVIGLGHLGVDPASRPWTSEEVIANVSGLDAFIDGHSHTEMESKAVAGKDGGKVILTQTGEYVGRIGAMLISAEGNTVSPNFIEYAEITEVVKDESGAAVLDEDGKEVTEVVGYEFVSNLDLGGTTWASDESVAAIKDAWITEIDSQLGQTIGSTALTFDNYDAEGKRLVRSQETNTGDFAADALYYLFDNMGLDVDVAVMNGGGTRNKAVTGELTYKVAKNIHTFGNVACLQTITGQQLLDALEWGARGVGTGEEIGGFLHVSGITYKIDDQWPTSVQMDDKGVWVGAPTGGYKVHDVQVYNKETGAYEPLDLTASYNLAGYNYTLRDLGDGFNMFDGAVNVLDYVMEDYMVLANYIQAFEGGVVEATNSPLVAKFPGMLLDYSTVNGSGRIVMEAAK